MAARFKDVYQFKVSLNGISPTVWRRIQVPGNYSFWDLHVSIQDSMGWLDYHLHAFRIPGPQKDEPDLIGIPDEDGFVGDPQFLPGWDIPIAEYFTEPGDAADYEYDFGDGWEHEILLEKIFPRKPRKRYPVCLAGERACPPEDCGGPPGYEELLRALRDPSHEEHERMLTWVGGSHDPTKFDPKRVRFDNPEKRWQKAFVEV